MSTRQLDEAIRKQKEDLLKEAIALLQESMTISSGKPEPSPLVYAIVKE